MSTEKKIVVQERVLKVVRGISKSSFKKLKNDGSPEAIKKAVFELRNRGVKYFEVVDQDAGKKDIYTKKVFGKNYEKVTVLID